MIDLKGGEPAGFLDADAFARAIEVDGAATIDSIGLGASQIDKLREESETLFARDTTSRRPAGVRSLSLKSAVFRDLIDSRAFRLPAEAILGEHAFAVRSILFDKTPQTNWDVPWHQDATIAVTRRPDDPLSTPGFGPWSTKDGVPHVQPPASVLERMITLRLHLDPCGPENGALQVVPGSHTRGFVDNADRAECERRARTLTVPAGGLIAMRPLTLHASKKAARPGHRRVVHIEFAGSPLPFGLEWARL